MNSLSRKWVFGDSVSLQHAKKRRKDKTTVDYTMCIICQGRRNKGLFNVQTTMIHKLMVAMTATRGIGMVTLFVGYIRTQLWKRGWKTSHRSDTQNVGICT